MGAADKGYTKKQYSRVYFRLLLNKNIISKACTVLYQTNTKQKLPISVDEAWSFLSNPKNLKTQDDTQNSDHLVISVTPYPVQ